HRQEAGDDDDDQRHDQRRNDVAGRCRPALWHQEIDPARALLARRSWRAVDPTAAETGSSEGRQTARTAKGHEARRPGRHAEREARARTVGAGAKTKTAAATRRCARTDAPPSRASILSTTDLARHPH